MLAIVVETKNGKKVIAKNENDFEVLNEQILNKYKLIDLSDFELVVEELLRVTLKVEDMVLKLLKTHFLKR